MTIGKYERSKEWKERVYGNPERSAKIANALRGRKLTKEHIKAIKKSHPQSGYMDHGYIRSGSQGIMKHRFIWCSTQKDFISIIWTEIN